MYKRVAEAYVRCATELESILGAVDALADRAPLLRDDALEAKLVDRIGFRDEAYLRIAQKAGADSLDDPDGEVGLETFIIGSGIDIGPEPPK